MKKQQHLQDSLSTFACKSARTKGNMATIARINISDRRVEAIVIVPEDAAGQSKVYHVLGDENVSEAVDLLNHALILRASREQ
jgi:citrate synthase